MHRKRGQQTYINKNNTHTNKTNFRKALPIAFKHQNDRNQQKHTARMLANNYSKKNNTHTNKKKHSQITPNST